jgi:hypothetical protein
MVHVAIVTGVGQVEGGGGLEVIYSVSDAELPVSSVPIKRLLEVLTYVPSVSPVTVTST